MDGKIERWMDRQRYGWTDGQMDTLTNRQMYKCKDRQMEDIQTNRLTGRYECDN